MTSQHRKSITERDVLVLEPAMHAFVHGKIDHKRMADVLDKWSVGEPFDLGLRHSLTDKIHRSLGTDGSATPHQLAEKLSAELDSVYHALARLQRKRLVRCDRTKRPFVWHLTTSEPAKLENE